MVPCPGGRLQQLSELTTMNKVDVLWEEEELMCNIQELACSPNEDIASVSISQVIGEMPKVAWDILPLTIKDVAKATREDKQYGKLYNAVRSGVLDNKYPDLKKFNGVFVSAAHR